jgi:HSP20 family molecular chaperone IbpA
MTTNSSQVRTSSGMASSGVASGAAANAREHSAQESANAGAPQRGRSAEAVLRTPVDIFETSESLVLMADMPGVAKERLDVRVDGDTLVLEGKVHFQLPEESEAVYADVRSTAYRSSFVLSRELDTDKIQANLKDGVLTVRIPKHAALRPRKIEVR